MKMRRSREDSEVNMTTGFRGHDQGIGVRVRVKVIGVRFWSLGVRVKVIRVRFWSLGVRGWGG